MPLTAARCFVKKVFFEFWFAAATLMAAGSFCALVISSGGTESLLGKAIQQIKRENPRFWPLEYPCASDNRKILLTNPQE